MTTTSKGAPSCYSKCGVRLTLPHLVAASFTSECTERKRARTFTEHLVLKWSAKHGKNAGRRAIQSLPSLRGGVAIWNRTRKVRDPRTGRRVQRLRPRSEWTVME